MAGIARRCNRDHGACFRHRTHSGKHSRTSETVADQNRRSAFEATQLVRSGNEVGHVRREIGVCELTFAGAETGEVEAQHPDAQRGQSFSNPPRGVDIVSAGEAVSEQRIGARLLRRLVEQSGEPLAPSIREIESSSRHGSNSLSVRSISTSPVTWNPTFERTLASKGMRKV